MVQIINGKKTFLLIVAMCSVLQAEPCGNTMQKSIDLPVNANEIVSINCFLSQECRLAILLQTYKTSSSPDFLYLHEKLITLEKYGTVLNGFINEGGLFLGILSNDSEKMIDVFQISNKLNRIVSFKKKDIHEAMSGSFVLLPASGEIQSQFIIGECGVFPSNPLSRFGAMLSGGHGTYYRKPCFVAVCNGKIGSVSKIDYGGFKDESFIAQEIINGTDSIHVLGFRGGAPKPGSRWLAEDHDIILHYFRYDLRNQKLLRHNSLFHTVPDMTEIAGQYGTSSMAIQNENVFVAFSMIEPPRFTEQENLKKPQSYIYFTQSSSKTFVPAAKVGSGLMPVIKADAAGNVHIFWVNAMGQLVHRSKSQSGWQSEKIIALAVDIYPGFRTANYICAEFDKENKLHLVYPSGGKLIYEKRTFDAD